ncbi:MAG: dihydrodipicolinate synthase family protein [Verrucomicrobiota bacterium]
MSTTSPAPTRPLILDTFFPQGVPPLWCPLLTHYDRDGAIDRARMAAHLNHLSAHVRGYLIPGSTGDGWEMNDAEIREVLEAAIERSRPLEMHILIGVLKTDAVEACQHVLQTMAWLHERTGEQDPLRALLKANVCGFTVCPPRGKDIWQQEIRDSLASILETGLPIALYQLPQMTQNEMSPEVVHELATKFQNFILFKDTSGRDIVAEQRLDLGGVLLVRGAEGDYARWLLTAGGPYHGFLLSTANTFARELHRIIEDCTHGRTNAAAKLSERLTSAVREGFALVDKLPQGNAFANGNKAFDHFFAHGPKAAEVPPPRLHAGVTLPIEVIRAAGEVLARHGFMPKKGYLE